MDIKNLLSGLMSTLCRFSLTTGMFCPLFSLVSSSILLLGGLTSDLLPENIHCYYLVA